MGEDDRPEWWSTNEAIREELDLPPYEPPRFVDGVHTHEVVPELESRYDCTIRLLGVNTTYPDAWELRIDGETVRPIRRRRDANGNTVYELTAAEFRAAVARAVGDDEAPDGDAVTEGSDDGNGIE